VCARARAPDGEGQNLGSSNFYVNWREAQATASRHGSSDMNDLEQISVRRLLQWAGSCELDRLRVNDEYPRSANVCDITEKGRYLHSVLCGTDITILVVNTTSMSELSYAQSEDRSQAQDRSQVAR
jgi:hypothetical protein